MPVNILMPALSPTMEKGNLVKWLKQEGDKVKPGDVIAEIETDKATMEYEAIDEGTLARIVVAEGTQDVPVNQLIAVLAEEGEDVAAAAAGAGKGAVPAKALSAVPPSPQPSPLRGEGVAPSLSHQPRLFETRERESTLCRKRSRLPLPAGERVGVRGPAPPDRATITESSPRHLHADLPRKHGSISRASRVPARTGG